MWQYLYLADRELFMMQLKRYVCIENIWEKLMDLTVFPLPVAETKFL
ncbi:hypothetical protein GA0061105_101687 [Rhizobium aethiopicum]|uniref:Uncharacterized protein n=1 Tax=Rhizobium aethiopicum TaxID=1138170 RepID=A0A1C3XX92_9HYPH|nr:hypothetical protein GA0061105_101687 [Rhizobium aethiopicum]